MANNPYLKRQRLQDVVGALQFLAAHIACALLAFVGGLAGAALCALA